MCGFLPIRWDRRQRQNSLCSLRDCFGLAIFLGKLGKDLTLVPANRAVIGWIIMLYQQCLRQLQPVFSVKQLAPVPRYFRPMAMPHTAYQL